jgi:hypothetical protein
LHAGSIPARASSQRSSPASLALSPPNLPDFRAILRPNPVGRSASTDPTSTEFRPSLWPSKSPQGLAARRLASTSRCPRMRAAQSQGLGIVTGRQKSVGDSRSVSDQSAGRMQRPSHFCSRFGFLSRTDRLSLTVMKYGLFTIELTPDEIALADAMSFDDLSFPGNHQAFMANAEKALRLTKSLVAREAIPDQRTRYLVDSDYNPGGRGKSRQESFERNGTRGDDILRHPRPGSQLAFRTSVNGRWGPKRD